MIKGIMTVRHFLMLISLIPLVGMAQSPRQIIDFNKGWSFILGDDSNYVKPGFDSKEWRMLDLPHDWSIEGRFDSTHPARNAGGALPGGIGWYRKTFTTNSTGRKVYIEFDGVHRNSEVWINGHYLGKWPYGYTAFRYELSRWLKPAGQINTVAVRVDNSQQPNSRWYTGSGIYRDVKLVVTNKTAIKHWGSFITTPQVNSQSAIVSVEHDVQRDGKGVLKFISTVYDAQGKKISEVNATTSKNGKYYQTLAVNQPQLWSISHPYLYKMVTKVFQDNKWVDEYSSTFGIRYFNFDVDNGFSLNGQYLKILGVCQHHDLGALGAAYNESAARRQLKILREMGVNAIRMAHNPPAARLLDLCDEMGFLVMDESFDMWAKKKNKFDYSIDFPEWHQRDLEHMIKRDRNHPSVIIWSIGNEIREQFDSTGITITRDLVKIVKDIDTTRPVLSALTETDPEKNYIYQSGALDIIGLNYKIDSYKDFQKNFPGVKVIASENVSGLASRGHYDMPSDSLRLWPSSSKFKYVENGNPDFTVSAYDNVAAYWGVTHENNWWQVKRYKYMSGLFVWSGFDFLGEPVPYPYPARSSYYGIIDMAGFPKDVYYMYQSEWTTKPVLHLYPHWNWKEGQLVDVKTYYNNADEVELFVNGKSLGRKTKIDTAFHVMWRVPYEAGELKAVSYKNNKQVLSKIIKTAGADYRLELSVENKIINSKKNELAFITARVVDKEGNLVPDADQLVKVNIEGAGNVAGMDNGNPADVNSLKDAQHHIYKGLLLSMIKGVKPGQLKVTLNVEGLPPATTLITVK
ncbi:glycoside hydrolase family 2 TIM barrel-domain containing protein [Niabella yanshanensis]|uniref:Glycoside hydrolase family 2 TIM barrel-domain containing protein n=1 Tax=Niabella yanshanensis TaxID=577386 RepID=A0ABZ0W7Z1_9BACT|nr:glycoside hydrolase family 2 TIM barrel-domain containing protein [Niabella yanshanensis]WQD39271.1 glycoside hydrolase family 2 TIM barrel-domain containing protein [Niabella yanshanensis]